MTNLIIMHDQQAVTSSLNVAETFGKRHDHVLRDIDEIKGVTQNWGDLFHETTYIHEQNKQSYRMFLMNRDGFTLLAFGFTGKDALKFKVDYIQQFNAMEKSLQQPKALTEREQLEASMKLSLMTSEDVQELKSEVVEIRGMVENRITLEHGEQRRLQKLISSKVFEHAKTDEHKKLLYPELHREIKDRFAVASYKDVKNHELQSAIRYIESWIPRKVR